MALELEEVRRTVDGLTREQLGIAHRWNDGAGTYAPPGHWNDLAAEHVRDARMSEVRAARTLGDVMKTSGENLTPARKTPRRSA